MSKKTILSLLVALLVIFLIPCSTSFRYDKPMYRRLSNPELYDEFSMIIKGVEYRDADTGETKEYTPDIQLKELDEIFIIAYCDSRETYIDFFGGISDETTDEMISTRYIRLKVCKENNDILLVNDFYKEINPGDNITVSATHFVAWDQLRTYTCSIKTENKTYLDFDEGLSNIVKMMDIVNQNTF